MALPPNGRVILKTSVGEIQRYRGGQLMQVFYGTDRIMETPKACKNSYGRRG
ncbi:uncharacterized protein EI90DRAFT_3196719 [Cantharellus anzutake]|uniref:uncharacterized protein n=1 Tax=Cantharellus anzutake TaxID=1750568 RepID=UPI001906F88D|nr:uncharacterized protein EI90DRAFT_3196719 [Cantharellus anzutake]KAF8331691.1 hypothetical protein EI90DRAFT_3196719 [Cantharellus anzutake]